MGGDSGLPVTVPGALAFLKQQQDVHLIMVGDESAVRQALSAANAPMERITVLHASEVVGMDEAPQLALKNKKDSSMRIAINQVKEGTAQAAVSAGNTGALMATARFVLKTIPGIDRPAIAKFLPSDSEHLTLALDLGANVDCTPEQLVQFAIIGNELFQALYPQKGSPRIGLLNVGTEDIKGTDTVKQTFKLLKNSKLNFIGNIGYVVMAILGGWLAINGRLKIGDIQAFIQYIDQFNQPLVQVANIANILQSTAAAAERVFEFLDEPEEQAESKDLVKLANVKGEVEFDNVVFGYKPDQTIIKGLSAHIKPGQRVAIVGPTGAGKTTLVNLLMRFYEINSGAIKIDGVDIRQMKRSDVRQMFGMVLQDTWLFNGTIRQNLLYGNPTASEEEMIATAKEAHVDHFVRSLPGGYDMMLGEEATNISQGEKQLLTIARAMLARTPMLILDEATSSVDTRTEVLIQKAMDKLMQGKTSFVIAHRLSTVKGADAIHVLDRGRLVESGTHEQLVDEGGLYASLWRTHVAARAIATGKEIER